ncbi:hypothetical protein [Stappia sp. MMSF_3263]|uniref:hypothetical protein n=1 Tax=Stappia sp. MMSF_3263 TaxID=3046693 RepID=UPI00273E503F|nr:hypothetical protein [Stappia sp. MMSF_3263]
MRRGTFDTLGASRRAEDERAAMFLAVAVAVGLLFAGSLTMFGGPLTETIRDLGPQAMSADQR